MKPAKILPLAALLALPACNASFGGGVRPDPLPGTVAAPCPHPASIAHGSDWEIFAGRIGDALIDCGAAKELAVTAYDDLRGALAGKEANFQKR